LYVNDKKSTLQIAEILSCSQGKINYWLKKYNIQKRTISDSIYLLKNPNGDPFKFKKPYNIKSGILFGLGLGLYWGEGDKRGNEGARLSNSDPKLIKSYINFLIETLGIDKERLRFSIQIPPDLSSKDTLNFWINELNLNKNQFYKPYILKKRGNGSYKNKSKYGTIIVYFNNIKLKKLICNLIDKL
jgi:hypothetical protein